VQTQDDGRGAITLVNVMNPDAAAITRVNLGVMRLKGIVRQILKLAIGCSKSFHYVQPPEVIA
jgi:hypothetical protein